MGLHRVRTCVHLILTRQMNGLLWRTDEFRARKPTMTVILHLGFGGTREYCEPASSSHSRQRRDISWHKWIIACYVSSSLAFDRYRSCIIESMGLSHITTLTTYLNNISTLEVNLEYEVVDKKSKGRPRLHPKKLGLTFLIYHCSIHVVCMHASALSRQVYIWERLIYLLIYPFTFFFFS